jgi:autotransporter-associated beta strand protein
LTNTTALGGSVSNTGFSGTNQALAVLNLGNNNATASFSGVISYGTIIKSGTGTQTFSGANTYSGGTTVSAGTLLINNTLGSGTGSGTVSIAAGATLGGTGTISGATTVLGNLNAGDGGSTTETLAFGNTLDLTNAQTTTFNVAGLTRGSGYDGIDVTSLLTSGGALVVNFSSALLPASGTTTFDLFALNGGETGTFSSVSIAGSYTATLTQSSDVWTGGDSAIGYVFTESTGDLVVTSAIPEPSTYAAIFGGLALAGAVARRRRGSAA